MLSFLRILFRNGPLSAVKIHKAILLLALKVLFFPLAALEYILYHRKISKHRIVHAPVFIIGHWRSGTTFLHQVLSQDSSKAILNFYQATFPGFFILTEGFLKPLLQKLVTLLQLRIPYFNDIPFDWNFPCEEDTALVNMGARSSAYWAYIFPRHAEAWFAETMFFEGSDSRNEKRWRREYMYLVKKLSYRHSGRQLVLKSPPNTARMRQLLQLFPGAKFIYLHRDPVQIYYSHLRLWKENNRYFALQSISGQKVEEILLRTMKKLRDKYEADKCLVAGNCICEVMYSDLVKDPLQTVKNLYSQLGLENYEEAEKQLLHFISRRQYETFHYEYDAVKSREIQEFAGASNKLSGI